MIYLTGYRGRREGGVVPDGDLGRARREYLETTVRNELKGMCGGTFHLRVKALQGVK